MQHIIDYAKQKRLRRMYGDVLNENTAMLQMCTELGFHARDMGPHMKRVLLEMKNVE
jgi:acetyltransferase